MWKREEIGRSNKVTTSVVVLCVAMASSYLEAKGEDRVCVAVVSCNVGVGYIQRKLVDHIQTVNEEVLHVER